MYLSICDSQFAYRGFYQLCDGVSLCIPAASEIYHENIIQWTSIPFQINILLLLCYAVRGFQRIAFNRVALSTMCLGARTCVALYVKNHTFSSTHIELKLFGTLLLSPSPSLYLLSLPSLFLSLSFGGNINSTTAHHLDNGFVTYFAFSAHTERSHLYVRACALTHSHIHTYIYTGWARMPGW